MERADRAAGVGGTDRSPTPRDASVPVLAGAERLLPGNVATLQRLAGNRATTAFVRAARPIGRVARAILARLGTALDQDLPPGAEIPVYGEDKGEQRRYSKPQFIRMWEAEQGHKLTLADQTTINLGCIGITSNNLGGHLAPPLDEVYDTFDKAHKLERSSAGNGVHRPASKGA